ncbi:MAG: DUF4271 domain-containing protein [Bacteroidales bacterium]|nr:DUF4271 domain-containing protein [Bacteroidales bacterium]
MVDTVSGSQFTDSSSNFGGSSGNMYHDYKIKFETPPQTPLEKPEYSTHQAHLNEQSPAMSLQDYSNDWIIVLLLLSITIFGWIQFFFKKSFNQTYTASFVYKDAVTLYKNRNSVSNRISWILNFLFFINYSVYVLLFIEKNSGAMNDKERLVRFAVILGVLLIFIMIKNLLYYSTAVLFDILKVVKEYVYNGSIYNKLAGILILPVLLAYAFLPDPFSSWMGYLGIFIFLFTYFLQLFRGFQIVLRNGYSLRYSLLYLLTIELLPLALLVKWVLIRSN